MIHTLFAAGIITDRFEQRALQSPRATPLVITPRTEPTKAATS